MVIGLASVIMGIQLLTPETGTSPISSVFKKELRPTTAVIAGSVLYKACISAAISLGLEANDLKLITSILFLIILVVSTERRKKVKTHA